MNCWKLPDYAVERQPASAATSGLLENALSACEVGSTFQEGWSTFEMRSPSQSMDCSAGRLAGNSGQVGKDLDILAGNVSRSDLLTQQQRNDDIRVLQQGLRNARFLPRPVSLRRCCPSLATCFGPGGRLERRPVPRPPVGARFLAQHWSGRCWRSFLAQHSPGRCWRSATQFGSSCVWRRRQSQLSGGGRALGPPLKQKQGRRC